MTAAKKPKPRVRFCWECGKQLYGNHFVEIEVEKHPRILHKQCAEWIKKGIRVPNET